jgi:hypothetical protein
MRENEFAPLEIYIGFDTLPAWQLSRLMLCLSNIYALLSNPDVPSLLFEPDEFYDYRRDPWESSYLDSDLCLDFARTGNSITLRFDGHDRWPKLRANSNNDVELVFPNKWGPTVMAVGVAVAGAEYSMHLWKSYLEREQQRAQTEVQLAEVERKRAEVDLLRAQTDEIHERMRQSRTSAPRVPPRLARNTRPIQRNINVFNNIIYSGNINQVSINGLQIKPPGKPQSDTNASETN